MFHTQKKFEETVTVLNESSPIRGSGGIAIISDGTSQNIRMLMLPDSDRYRERRKDGQYLYERLFAQIRKTEMDKVDMIPGKTRVVWNGNEYKVIGIIDYRSKVLFQNAEIELRRRLDID